MFRLRDHGCTEETGELQIAALCAEIILCAVRWYLRYLISHHEVQEPLAKRGLELDCAIVWGWIQQFAPELEERTRPRLKPTDRSWRVDGTCVRTKGRRFCIYRAFDSAGATIDFTLSMANC